MAGPSRWHALVLAMAMLAGCETRAPKNSGGARILTDAEMIRITACSRLLWYPGHRSGQCR